MKLQGKNIIDKTEIDQGVIKSFQDNFDNEKTVAFIVAGEITRETDENQNIKYGHFVFDNGNGKYDTYFVVTNKGEIVFIKNSDIGNIDTAPLKHERTTTSSVKEKVVDKDKNGMWLPPITPYFKFLNRIIRNRNRNTNTK